MNDETTILDYTDRFGMLTQRSGDGGDSCFQTMHYSFGKFLINDKDVVKFNYWLSRLRKDNGVFVRHPDPTKWYSNPLNFSRDQTRALVFAMGAYGVEDQLKYNLLNLVKNFGFYPNKYPNYVLSTDSGYTAKTPDFASPENYAEYIRALYMTDNKYMLLLYPLVLLGDVFKLIGTLISVFYTDRDLSKSDDTNAISSHLQALNSMPTPLSWLARKIHSKYRPVIPNDQGITNGLESAMWAYWSGNNRPEYIEPMYYLYKPLLDKWFK